MCVLQGHFQLDRRFLLEMEVRTNGEVIYDAIALNDVVLHSEGLISVKKPNRPRLIPITGVL
jgi:NAD kinase